MSSTVIGIDLGTTNTCVACYSNGRVKILENSEGGRVTPSYIYVTEKNKITVGYYAQRMADAKPEYGVYEMKRLIGRNFDDPYVQNNLKYFSFMVADVNNEPVVSVKRKNDEFTATPIQLCTAILKKIKTDTEDKIGGIVDKAVITVPAYFNNAQRQATLSAAHQAGFTVLKLLSEPTAAALSYYLEQDEEENYSLVYDLGGGTFDVAILKRNGNNIDIIGVDGHTHLGGHDFDNLIVDYVCEYLQKTYKYDAKSDRRDLRRIRNECEAAKKVLSLMEDTVIVLNGLIRDCVTVEIEITRDQFEKMTITLFNTTIDIVDNCLKACSVSKTDIKEVILAGGSTRIPKIQSMISEYFGGKKVNRVVNPDECVAEGAALQAAMLSRNKRQEIGVFKITDVTPLSLGVPDFVDLMAFFIKRNTPIPVSKTYARITIENQQKSMTFDIYEGERPNAKMNHLLGSVTINNITPAPPGQCAAYVTMSIDENGILKVTAKEEHRNNVKNLTIVYTRGHRSDKEVKNALKDAEDHKAEDKRFINFAHLKEFVLNYCEQAKYNFENLGLEVVHKSLYDLCKEKKNLASKMDLNDEKELEVLHNVIRMACDGVVKKYNFEFMPTLRK